VIFVASVTVKLFILPAFVFVVNVLAAASTLATFPWKGSARGRIFLALRPPQIPPFSSFLRRLPFWSSFPPPFPAEAARAPMQLS
jgi:hypothetical protein